jgi:hypothetical protein
MPFIHNVCPAYFYVQFSVSMFSTKFLSRITFTNDIEKIRVKPLVPRYGGRAPFIFHFGLAGCVWTTVPTSRFNSIKNENPCQYRNVMTQFIVILSATHLCRWMCPMEERSDVVKLSFLWGHVLWRSGALKHPHILRRRRRLCLLKRFLRHSKLTALISAELACKKQTAAQLMQCCHMITKGSISPSYIHRLTYGTRLPQQWYLVLVSGS